MNSELLYIFRGKTSLMKRILLPTLVFLLILVKPIYGQEICGFDDINNTAQTNDPNYSARLNSMNEQISDYIVANQNAQGVVEATNPISSTAEYIIPVVVHILNSSGTPVHTISYAQVERQIDALNRAFANSYTSPNPLGSDTKIQFCLAQTPYGPSAWSNSTEPGVMRHITSYAQEPNSLLGWKNILGVTHPSNQNAFPFDKFLNIWVLESIGPITNTTLGYSPNKNISNTVIDGVVIVSDVFGDNSGAATDPLLPNGAYKTTLSYLKDEGKELPHLVGHYLGLFHTYNAVFPSPSSCEGTGAWSATSAAGSCNWEGDFCCDTDPCNVPTTPYNCTSTSPTACAVAATPAVGFIHNNYMYKSYDPCMNMFTLDQSNRMVAYINLYRSQLVNVCNAQTAGIIGSPGCIQSGPFADFTFSPAGTICTNNPVDFDICVPSPNNTAITYSWSFGGGPAITPSNTVPNPQVTWTTAGTYTVSCTVSDGVNPSVTSTQSITVLGCTLNPDYMRNANWYFGQFGSIAFGNGSPTLQTDARDNQTLIAPTVAFSTSDNSGNLLYYTDGIDAWESSTQAKINANAIFPQNTPYPYSYTGYTPSVTKPEAMYLGGHGMMGIPSPADPNKHLLFATKGISFWTNPNNAPYNVRYTEINLPGNSVGTTTVLNSNPTFSSMVFSQALTIIPHCNGHDYWVVTLSHNSGFNSNNPSSFFVYLVSDYGVSTEPVISGPINYQLGGDLRIFMKASPTNDKIVISKLSPVSSGPHFGVYSFDNSTGIVSNESFLTVPTAWSPATPAGFSFDHTGNRLFCIGPWYGIGVRYYDFTTSSFTTISPTVDSKSTLLQLGPDNHIYFTTWAGSWDDKLYRIDNPSTSPTYSGTPVMSFHPDPSAQRIHTIDGSLPNLMDGVKPSYTAPSIAVSYIGNDCNDVEISFPCWGGYDYLIDWGDGSPIGPSITAAQYASAFPTHSYAPGSYIITVDFLEPGTTTPTPGGIQVSASVGSASIKCCASPSYSNHIFVNPKASDIYSHFSISPGFAIQTDFAIEGTLTVDVPTWFANNNVIMGEDAEIVVNAGIEFKCTDGAKLEGICDRMWKGITVTQSNSLATLTGGCMFLDMIQGVLVENNGKLDATGCYFHDNLNSIYLKDLSQSYVGIIQSNFFETVKPNLWAPHTNLTRGNHGITIVNCEKIEIGSYTVNGWLLKNHFENLSNGINIYNSLSSSNQGFTEINTSFNTFKNIGGGQTPWSVAAYPYPFSEDWRGSAIYSMNTVQNYRLNLIHFGGRYDNPTAIDFNECDEAVLTNATETVFRKNVVEDCISGCLNYRTSGIRYTIMQNKIDNAYWGFSLSGDTYYGYLAYNDIENLKANPIPSPTSNSLSFFGRGISSYFYNSNGASPHVYLRENDINTNAEIGILGIIMTRIPQNSTIEANQIHFNSTSSDPDNYNEPTLRGIFLAVSNGATIMGNEVHGLNTANFLNNRFTAGLYIHRSVANYTACNIFNNLQYGEYVVGDCSDGTYDKVNANHFNTSRSGILYRQLGVQGMLGDIGAASTYDANNQFYGTNTLANLYKLGCGAGGNENLFSVYSPITSGSNGSCNILLPNAAPYAETFTHCGNAVFDPPPPMNGVTDMGDAGDIASDNKTYAEFPVGMERIDERDLYEDLDNDPNARQANPLLNQFYTQHQSTAMAYLYETDLAISAIFDSISMVNPTLYAQNLQQAISLNNMVVSNEPFELQERSMNEKYFKVIQAQSLSQAEWIEIEQLAKKCPYIDGYGVYKARQLYTMMAPGAHFDDLPICNSVGYFKRGKSRYDEENELLQNAVGTKNSLLENIKVYPNPANSYVTVDLDYNKDNQYQFELYDITGRRILKETLLGNKTIIYLPEISIGLYSYKIVKNSNLIKTDKLIIE